MKKILVIFVSIIALTAISFAIYWNLPVEITRKSDIRSGNKLVQNIENYRKANHKLPENNDWQTLEKIGFLKDEPTHPVYTSDEAGNYELVYFEGFDGPYLMWNSQERKWTIDFPKIVSE